MSKLTYHNGRYYRDGQPFFVIASDYMYFRDRREHWADRLGKLKEAGINVITTYIPWRHHLRLENGERRYDFTGETKDSRDVVTFLKTVESFGFYLILKPGPFVHSELNIGGLPDFVSPTYNPEVPAARRHHGGPAIWTYDASQLPAPFDERFDALVKEWFDNVREVIRPYDRDDGPLIGLQLVDETIYCTSNDPPWRIGYEPSGMHYYHGLLREEYGDLETYNRLHGTEHAAWAFVPAPRLKPEERETRQPKRPEDLLLYVDWAHYQWRYRRDLYARYKEYLGIDVPYLTNFAGITPPIEENVPDLQDEAVEEVPQDFQPVYSEWWLAMNRVDTDVDVHEYGLISWLGVAAYDPAVFDRYINTARRSRGINMEENWGFAKLYDERSKYPMIPVFQTLVSVAGGATGYDIFVGVSSDYWDETLDRITKIQHPTFPSDAPLDEHGNKRALYTAAEFLCHWFEEHGHALLACEPTTDVAYLLYAPYAAVSSWIPNGSYWGLEGREIPRCGHEGLEEFSRSCQESGFAVAMFELEAADEKKLAEPGALAIQSAFFMDAECQEKLAAYVRGGGRLFISGDLPTLDLRWEACTVLKDAVEAAVAGSEGKVVYRQKNLFTDGNLPATLRASGIEPLVTYSENMRAYVHRHGDADDAFVFFFNFDVDGTHEKQITFAGDTIELTLGSKTCGVLRLRDGKLVGHLIKGENEVESIKSPIRLRWKDQVVEGVGDLTSSG
jgi:beta-galactosidase